MAKIRPYQLELLEKAKESNIIAYLPTGTGKTFISIKLMEAIIESQPSKLIAFLAPSNALVHQQAISITNNTDLKVISFGYSGQSMLQYTRASWKQEFGEYQVLVLTPQVLIYLLQHAFVDISEISLLIFDECHHAHKSNPYCLIMKTFYHPLAIDRPKIMGMTASPIISGSFGNLQAEMQELEQNLDARLVTATGQSLHEYTNTAQEQIIEITNERVSQKTQITDEFIVHLEFILDYLSEKSELTKPDSDCIIKGDITSHRLILNSWLKQVDSETKAENESLVKKLLFILEAYCILGPLAALYSIKLLVDSLQVVGAKRKHIDDEVDALNVIQQSDLSPKVWELLLVLQRFHSEEEKRSIIFVDQRLTAELLSNLLNYLAPRFLPWIKSSYIMGPSKRTSAIDYSAQQAQKTVEDFANGAVNTLIATRVAEEGIDIATCHLVIIFDFFRASASYVQSRGRAREKKSLYIVFIQKNDKATVKKFVNAKRAAAEVHDIVSNEKLEHHSLLVEKNDDIVKLLFGGYDKPFVTEKNAQIFPISATHLIRWVFNAKRFPGEVVIRELAVSEEDYPAYLNLLEEQWRKDLGNENEKETLKKIDPESASSMGFIYKATITMIDSEPFDLYGSIRASRKAAINSTSFVICQYLYQEKYLDDYLLPCNRLNPLKLLTSLPKPVDQENIPRKCPEAFKKKESAKCITLIQFEEKVLDEVVPEPFLVFNKNTVGLITCGDIDCSKIKPFHVWLKQKAKTTISVETVQKEVHFTANEMLLINMFQKWLWNVIMNSSSRTNLGETNYEQEERFFELVPLFNSAGTWEIDWSYINLVASHAKINLTQILRETPSTDFKLGGCLEENSSNTLHPDMLKYLLVKTAHNGMIYKNLELQPKILATATFPKKIGKETKDISFKDYFGMLGVENVSGDLPTVSASLMGLIRDCTVESVELKVGNQRRVTLVQEACEIVLCTSRFAVIVQTLPSVLFHLETHCLIGDFFKSIDFLEPSREIVYPAFLSTAAELPENYERLEILGDSFLKYASTVHLSLLKSRENSENLLTKLRSNLVKNSRLYQIGQAFKLVEYIEVGPFNAGQWRPPGMPQANTRPRKIHFKTVADVVEALLAACVLEGGENLGFQFLEKCDLFKVEIPKLIVSVLPERELHPVEKLLGYQFTKKNLLVEALSHTSKASVFNYERFEFIGDAVLDFLLMHHLYLKYPDADPGTLSFLKVCAVNNDSFSFVAFKMGLQEHIVASRNVMEEIRLYCNRFTEKQFDPDIEGQKVLADVFEAIVGAIFVDSGYSLDITWKHIYPVWQDFLDRHASMDNAIQSSLRLIFEKVQSFGISTKRIHFKETREANRFTCVINLDEFEISSEDGPSKVEAKRKAARYAINWIENNQNLITNIKQSTV